MSRVNGLEANGIASLLPEFAPRYRFRAFGEWPGGSEAELSGASLCTRSLRQAQGSALWRRWLKLGAWLNLPKPRSACFVFEIEILIAKIALDCGPPAPSPARVARCALLPRKKRKLTRQAPELLSWCSMKRRSWTAGALAGTVNAEDAGGGAGGP